MAEPPALPPTPNAAPVAAAPAAPAPSEPPVSVESLKREEIEVAQQLINDFPDQADPLGLLGNVYSKRGLNAEAVRCWERVIALDPTRPSTYDAMATVALGRQEYERALELWRKALSVSPELPGVHCRMAEALLGLGKAAEALEELKKEPPQGPLQGQTHYLRGRARGQLGDTQGARQDYEAATKADPNHTASYHQLSIICTRLKQPQQAAAYRAKFQERAAADRDASLRWRHDYDDLTLVRRETAATCNHAAGFYYTHRNPLKAERLWLRAAALDPDNAKSYLSLGILYIELKRFDAAEAAYRKARELAPKQSWTHRMLAQVLLQSDRNPAEALALARKAVQLESNAENYYVLGVAEERNGDREQARSAIRRAAELAPDNSKYKSALEQLQARE